MAVAKVEGRLLCKKFLMLVGGNTYLMQNASYGLRPITVVGLCDLCRNNMTCCGIRFGMTKYFSCFPVLFRYDLCYNGFDFVQTRVSHEAFILY